MTGKPASIVDTQRRRANARASLAIEGLYLTTEEERMLDQFEAEKLTPEQRRERVRDYGRSLRERVM